MTLAFELNYLRDTLKREILMTFRRRPRLLIISALFFLAIGAGIRAFAHGNAWDATAGFLLGMSLVILLVGLLGARRGKNSTMLKSS